MEITNDYNQEEISGAPEVNEVHATNDGSACREEDNLNDYKQDPLKILEHVKITNTLETPLSTIKCVFKDSKGEELSFKKVELRKVEERMRVVFIEFYQKLRLLKHYRWCKLNDLYKFYHRAIFLFLISLNYGVFIVLQMVEPVT